MADEIMTNNLKEMAEENNYSCECYPLIMIFLINIVPCPAWN